MSAAERAAPIEAWVARAAQVEWAEEQAWVAQAVWVETEAWGGRGAWAEPSAEVRAAAWVAGQPWKQQA